MVTYGHGGQVRYPHSARVFLLPFVKGQSGFPAGRTKAQREREKMIADAIDGLAGPDWKRYLGRMDQIIMTGEDRDAIAMLKIAMERALGKPPEYIVHEEPRATPEEDAAECRLIMRDELVKLSPAERLQLLAEIGQSSSTETVQ